jgi:membrane protein required for colicin V production
MNVLDIVLLLIVVGSLAAGLIKGLVSELISVLGVAAGIVLGLEWGPDLALLLGRWIRPEAAARTVGFVVVFLGALLLAGFLSWVLGKLVSASPLSPGNRMAGGVFGLARGLLLALIVVMGLGLFLDAETALLRDSRLTPYLGSGARALAPLLPQAPRAVLEEHLDRLPRRERQIQLREDVVWRPAAHGAADRVHREPHPDSAHANSSDSRSARTSRDTKPNVWIAAAIPGTA